MTKVLVVEDERYIRELLVDTLIDLGFDVLESVDGGEAYQKAFQETPDLILLDVMMPVMDGFEVLAKLRRSPETEAIPIIMLTSIAAADREQDAYNLGVNHYICKPFEAANLESTIRVALREFRIAAGLDPDLEAVDGSSREASDENSDENSDESSGELSTVGGGSNPFNSANELIDIEAEVIQDTGYITIGESLTALEKQLGGGIRQGTVTLMVGASGTGKSVLCQTMPLRPFRTATGWLISVLISPR
jgi:CheY-like chemotaxis protein